MSTANSIGWGVEVEVENNPKPYRKKQARVIAEGSLRNSGREYVSDILNLPKDVKHWHKLLVGGLSRMGCDFSERCGVHIHMDFRGHNILSVKHFLKNYTLVERFLFRTIDAYRVRSSSNFCIPLLDAPGTLARTLRVAENPSQLSYGWKKYSAINLGRLHDLGSIEFRGLPALGSHQLFNIVIDILNDARTLPFSALISKYGIPAKDVAEVGAFWAILGSTAPRHTIQEEVMERHFKFKKEDIKASELTEALILETIRELGL